MEPSEKSVLEKCLSQELAAVTKILGVNTPKQGLSNETLLLDLLVQKSSAEPVTKRLVLRKTPKIGLFEKYDLRRQYDFMRVLWGSGVPVPKVLGWYDQIEGASDGPLFFMEYVHADIPPENWFKEGVIAEASVEDRAEIGSQFIQTIAKIHALNWQSLGLGALNPFHGEDALMQDIQIWESRLEYCNASSDPVLSQALRWLKSNAPVVGEVTLVHGDCKPANYGFLNSKCVVVFDWELAHLGDPIDDIGWLLAHEHRDGSPPDGFPGRTSIVSEYVQITGRSLVNLDYYEAYALFRFLVIGKLAMRNLGGPIDESDFTPFEVGMIELMSL